MLYSLHYTKFKKESYFCFMNIQAEKIELIRLITEINSEVLLKKIRKIVTIEKNDKKNDSFSPAMIARIKESEKQIAEGKGIKVTLDDIWK